MSRLTAAIALFVVVTINALAPTAAAASEAEVVAVQSRLSDLGYPPGPIDGIMGPRTRSAVKDFQRANALRPSGRLDPKTLSALFPTSSAELTPTAAGRLLSYRALRWHGPQSGEELLTRFRSQTGSLDMKRSGGELIVANGDSVYLIGSGNAVPGFDCDPAEGRIEMEFMLGPTGPVVFRSLDGVGYCQLGFGILLEVGQRVRMTSADFKSVRIPGGEVEVGAKGLMYVNRDR